MLVDLTADELLATTRAVRKRLDLTRPVEREVLEERLLLAQQAPLDGGQLSPRPPGRSRRRAAASPPAAHEFAEQRHGDEVVPPSAAQEERKLPRHMCVVTVMPTGLSASTWLICRM